LRQKQRKEGREFDLATLRQLESEEKAVVTERNNQKDQSRWVTALKREQTLKLKREEIEAKKR
jgi:hypothetical protein